MTGTTVRAQTSEGQKGKRHRPGRREGRTGLRCRPRSRSARNTATVVSVEPGDGAGPPTRTRDDRLAHWIAPAPVAVDVLQDDDASPTTPADGYRLIRPGS